MSGIINSPDSTFNRSKAVLIIIRVHHGFAADSCAQCVAVHILDYRRTTATRHRGSDFFDLFAICGDIFIGIGYIILNAVQLHRCNSALMVIGIAHRVVTASYLGSTAVSIRSVVRVFFAVLGAVGDGGDATCFVIAIGKFTAALENLAQQLAVICGIAIACLMLAGGIGLGDKLAVLVIFPLGIELGGCVEGVIRDCSYLTALVVVFVFFDDDALGEFCSFDIAFGASEVTFIVVLIGSNRDIRGCM